MKGFTCRYFVQYILRLNCNIVIIIFTDRWSTIIHCRIMYGILTVHVYQHCHSEIWLHGVVVVSCQTRVCTISMVSIQLMNHKTFGCYFFAVVFVSVRYFLYQIRGFSNTERRCDFAVRGVPLHPWLGFPCTVY